MPWRPSEPNEQPSLGWLVLDWMAANLAAPDRPEYEPFIPYREQARFIVNWYALDPITGSRKYKRGVLCRPRGWGKSPLLAAICAAEALAPVRFAGWDAQGQPVGREWVYERTPLVQVAAVSEIQTKNTWQPLLEMLQNGPAMDNYPGLEPLNTMVLLPASNPRSAGGRIEFVTSSARSVKGNRAVFAVLDQSEEWVKSNGGKSLADTMRNNATKVGGTTLESPNAYTPGDESVAEDSANFWADIQEGRARDDSLLYDHREAPATTKLFELDSLRKGLLSAYGDAAMENGGHVDLDYIVARIMDPTLDPQVARADFLNQVTHASDSWITAPAWKACGPDEDDPSTFKALSDGDMVTLGFDGSVRDDSTALVACRVDDGHLELLGCWEKPMNRAEAEDWEVDREAVDAAVFQAMDRFKVVGFYADPAHWQDYVDRWTREFGRKMRVGVAGRPLEWWTNRPTPMCAALERFNTAVLNKELTHDGGHQLTRHVLNARRRLIHQGVAIRKSHPKSPNKIDAAMAATLAYEARCDAVAKRVNRKRTKGFMAQRAV